MSSNPFPPDFANNWPAAPAGAAGAAAAVPPRTVIRGESWIYVDPESGEKLLVIPVGRRGNVRYRSLPIASARPYSAITDWLNVSARRSHLAAVRIG